MTPKLTIEQAVILTAFTGKMLCPSFDVFHEAVEKRLGRPVWTHEFGSQEMGDRLREEFREDAIRIIPEVGA